MDSKNIEFDFSCVTKITKTDNGWVAALYREANKELHPVVTLRELSEASLYTKFGLEIERDVTNEEREEAESKLREYLTGLSGRTIVDSGEVQDILLDVLNVLPKGQTEDTITEEEVKES